MINGATTTADKRSDLSCYNNNVTSQHGEDGIIKEIFNRLGSGNRLCVEFGAWDGKHLSNTWSLWHEEGWSAILIEGDRKKYKVLEENVRTFSNVKTMNVFLTDDGENSLDNILAKANIESRIDLISIDIDGGDYYIFSSLQRYLPRCVIVEYNPTIPPEIDFVQKNGENFGCSAKALIRLAEAKGYQLAACTDTNCIFVHNEEFTQLCIEPVNLRATFPYHHVTYVVNTYDGKTFLNNTPVYTGYIKKRLISSLFGRFKKRVSDETTPFYPVVIRR